MARNLPVYIFSGLIDCGKTTCIKETLYDARFNEGERTLIISFEDGDVQYDERFLKLTNSCLVYLDSINDLTIEKIKELDKTYKPQRVFIELNGMEDDHILYEQGLIPKWEIAQHLTLIDASTFRVFVTNMKQFIYNHVYFADLCVFNRCDDEDKKYLRNNIKGINPKLQIVYENTDGSVTNKVNEDMFDVSKPFEVLDDDFGLWYMDALDNPEKYDKAKVTLKLRYIEPNNEYENVVYMGRNAMVCCSNDIAPVMIGIAGIDQAKLKLNHFYKISGTIHVVKAQDDSDTCVVYANNYEEVEALKDELVYFN